VSEILTFKNRQTAQSLLSHPVFREQNKFWCSRINSIPQPSSIIYPVLPIEKASLDKQTQPAKISSLKQMYEVARLKILSAQVVQGKNMATSNAFITFVQQ
jgi:hypothetical protein